MSVRSLGLLVLVALALSACTQPAGFQPSAAGTTVPRTGVVMLGETMEISNVWVRATPGAPNGAAYATFFNHSGATDRLIRAQSDVAGTVELHDVVMNNGVMAMSPVEAIEVRSAMATTLQPGGFHIMLIGLNRELVAGEMVNLTLTFEQAGEVQLQAEVR